jgi:type VI secretion system secreted protein VgrG
MPPPPYQLLVDGFPAGFFRVHSFTGKEALSSAYAFDIVATGDAGDEIERRALGQRATLLFNVGPSQRAFYGILAAVRVAGVHAAEHAVKLHIRLVPRLWLLKRTQRTRIFQRLRVPDIVTAVLAEAGIAVRWQLVRAYAVREFCTQYEETDYRFVKRLLAEAGIYFYFPTGPALDGAALGADAALGAAAAAGGAALDALGASGLGSLVGGAASLAATLIPGDTIICADDATCYPPVGGDDAAGLAASTAAALAAAVGGLLGAADGVAGAALGGASAIAGAVIADVTTGLRDAPVLHFLTTETSNVSTVDKVTRFALENSVRSSAATFRDYDPLRPLVRLQSTSVSSAPFPPSPLELAAQAAAAVEAVSAAVGGAIPGAASALGGVDAAVSAADAAVNAVGGALGQKVPFEVYEHHSPFLFPKWAFASDEAPRILRQKRRRASVADGVSGCPELSPGHRFALRDHPASQLDGAYAATTVEHRGQTHPEPGAGWTVYTNTFACVPAGMTYVPPRAKRKCVQVSLTATVVGPPGEEIHVDAAGQIRVQFHWDREGRYDERSSCWIRTMHPWGGAGWGHQFIPRVGMEVVVVFEGGDTDKPMVLGSLYNGTHPPPFLLPQDKTRSGVRTQSSPGGRGFNELSFEDRAGAEQILVVAQRDLDEKVAHDHTRSVGNHERVSVTRNRSLSVGGNHTETIKGNAIETVGGGRVLTVTGPEQETVVGDATKVAMAQLTVVVHGEYGINVGTAEKTADATVDVHGNYKVGASQDVRITATRSLRLSVGESVLEITPDEIKLSAKALTLLGTKSVSLEGKGPAMHLTDEAVLTSKTITLKSSQGLLKLDQEAKLKGKLVKLNCDDEKEPDEDDEKKPEPKSFRINLHDNFHKPYASKKYKLLVEGKELEGETDGDGLVEQDVSPEAASADLTLWLDKPGQDPKLQWHLTLADLPPLDTPHGVRRRLKNLGYYRVVPGQSNAEAAAIQAFQRDHGLPQTGKLDDATKAKLEEVHGH